MSTSSSPVPILKRFLSDNPVAYKKAIEAAESYVSNLIQAEIGVSWLYRKPFDDSVGHTQYFRLMYDLLNLLKVMYIPPQGRVLEIGCGPGWVTEILLMLGFRVDALEPSSYLIKIAQDRCGALADHYQKDVFSNVCFHHTTLEEVEFEDESFNAIIFFDVLHHVVDENKALEKSFRFLAPGGCIGVVEGAWHPDFKALEQELILEMQNFGTLENPFSVEYLDHLLKQCGFVDIVRYVSVNGFFAAEQLSQPLQNFSPCPFNGSNNLTARKPYGEFHECSDLNLSTYVQWNLLSGGIDPETRRASLVIRLENTGETLWPCQPHKVGRVTVALRRGRPGTDSFLEALIRHNLPKDIVPGESIDLNLLFTIPLDAPLDNWELDLVCEEFFWFSTRGIQSCPIP